MLNLFVHSVVPNCFPKMNIFLKWHFDGVEVSHFCSDKSGYLRITEISSRKCLKSSTNSKKKINLQGLQAQQTKNI